MFKKIVIFVFVLLCLTAAGTFVLTRPWFVVRIVRSAVNARASGWALTDLTIGKMAVDHKGSVIVEDARFAINQGEGKWQGEVPVFYLDTLQSLAGPQKKVTMEVAGAKVRSDMAQLQGISVKVTLRLTEKKWRIDGGSVHIDSLAAQAILLKALEARFGGDRDALTVDSWQAKWADGNLSGRLTVSPEAYTMHADVAQVDLSQIALQVRDMRGRLDGTVDIEIERATNAIGALKGYLDAPQGAELHAVFLQPLLTYIPASNQKNILEQLITENANVFFDHAGVHLENVRNDALHFLIEMDSKKLNLDIGVTVDLHVEGGLKSLLERLPQFISG